MTAAIYVDANATTPVLDVAKSAFLDALSAGNPSSPHASGRVGRRLIDDARRHVADVFGAIDREIVFTSGASEGNRLLVDALKKLRAVRGRPLRVWTSNLEHPSAARPLGEAHDDGDLVLETAHVGTDGQFGDVRFDAFNDAATTPDVFWVTHAHNETGIIPQLDAVLAALPENVVVVVDAAQSAGRLSTLPARVDAAVLSGHKLGAPMGVGALLRRGRAKSLPNPWTGGAQENGARPGTEALPLIAALGAAASVIADTRRANDALRPHRDTLEKRLRDGLDDVVIIGGDAPRLPQTTAAIIGGVDGDALRIALDFSGLHVGFGAACAALAPEPSAALLSLGVSAIDARRTVRLSLPIGFNDDDAHTVATRLIDTVTALRRRAQKK